MPNKITTVGWLSDSHLDYQQYGLRARRRDFAYAVKWAVKDMIEKGVDFIINTGDVVNSNHPSAEAITDWKEIHKMLIEAKTMMFTISGNHEFSKPSWLSLMDYEPAAGIHMIDDLGKVQYGGAGVTVLGYPSMSRERMLERFKSDDLEHVDILMIHAAVREYIGFPSPSALSIDDIPDKFQLVALGDIHVNDVRRRESGGYIGYPGSTELCSFSEDPVKVWKEIVFINGTLNNIADHVINTRTVLKWVVTSEQQLTEYLDAYTPEVIAGYNEEDNRHPMIFVEYPTTMPDVVSRIKSKLDPDKFIIIERPQFEQPEDATRIVSKSETHDLTIQDILNMKVPADDALHTIASAMLNPDADAKAALKMYVEGRLAEPVAEEVV